MKKPTVVLIGRELFALKKMRNITTDDIKEITKKYNILMVYNPFKEKAEPI